MARKGQDAEKGLKDKGTVSDNEQDFREGLVRGKQHHRNGAAEAYELALDIDEDQ